MKCFNHNTVDATAACQDCGKGLCVQCASRFDVILCESCLLAHNDRIARQMYMGLALTAIIIVGATYIFGSYGLGTGKTIGYGNAALVGLMFAFAYWGWRFLGAHLPRLVGGSGFAWVMYLALKFVIAYFIGIVVGPYQIIKHFREIHRARTVKRQIVPT